MTEIFLFGIFLVLVGIYVELRKFVEMAGKPSPQVTLMEPGRTLPHNGNVNDTSDAIGFKGTKDN